MFEVELTGGPMAGTFRAVPEGFTYFEMYGIVSEGTAAVPIGFYGPSETVPDGVWKWSGIYD
jgi:hypothetical protein